MTVTEEEPVSEVTAEPTHTMEIPTEVAQAQPTESGDDGMDMSGALPPPATVLDPLSIPKYVTPLVIPPVMPSEGQSDWNGEGELASEYWIAARQFGQAQVLPEGFPVTTVWGYGRYGDPLPGSGEPTTFNYPAFTVDVQSNELVRVVWVNQLVDDPDSASPNFLPSLTPIDQTIHWAAPMGMDTMEGHGADTTPYPWANPHHHPRPWCARARHERWLPGSLVFACCREHPQEDLAPAAHPMLRCMKRLKAPRYSSTPTTSGR